MLQRKRLGLHLIGRDALAIAREAARRRLPVWQMDLPDPLDETGRARFAALREQHPAMLVVRLPAIRESLIGDSRALADTVREHAEEAALWGADRIVLPIGVLPRSGRAAEAAARAVEAVADLPVALEPTRTDGYGGSPADLVDLLRGRPGSLGVSLNTLWLLRQGALAGADALGSWVRDWERLIGWRRTVLLKVNDVFGSRLVAVGTGELGTRGVRLLLGVPHLADLPWLTEVSPRLYPESVEGVRDAEFE